MKKFFWNNFFNILFFSKFNLQNLNDYSTKTPLTTTTTTTTCYLFNYSLDKGLYDILPSVENVHNYVGVCEIGLFVPRDGKGWLYDPIRSLELEALNCFEEITLVT
jgi:hypothetical protein